MRLIRYLSVIGLFLFAAILSSVDLKKTSQIILAAEPGLILSGIILVAVEVLIRSLNWQILANIWSKGYAYKSALETYLIGIAFGSVTPAKAGDFIKVGDLSEKTHLTILKAFTIGLLDRLINFVFLFLSACAGVAFLAMTFSGNANQLAVLMIPFVAAVAAILVSFNERISLMVLRPMQSFLVPERFRKNTREIFQTFHVTVSEFKNDGRKWAVLLLTLIGWLIIFIRPYFFAKAIGVDVGWLMFLVFIPILSVVEVLPISIMGLGTRDATLLFLFSLMGVERERMVALSTMMVILSMVPQTIIGYLIAWRRKVRDNNESPSG
jgi:glycosyltransferase 2 family protein